MDLDLFLSGDALSHQELSQIHPMVSLQLNDIAPLFMLDSVSIAAPCFLKVARQFFHVEVLGQPADRSQALTRIPLLKVQMHEIVPCGPRCLVVGVCTRTDCIEVVTAGAEDELVFILVVVFVTADFGSRAIFSLSLGGHLLGCSD